MLSHFSIIIPVYNVAPYLHECLNSVLAQTYSDWEAICVDDGSDDGSGQMLDEYAEYDSRFKVIHKENGGVASARNIGIGIATGDWIAFLDADDVWASWTLEYVNLAICEAEDADLVRFDTKDFQEKGEYPWNEAECVPYASELEDVSVRINSESVTHFFWGKVYRRDVLAGIWFENYTIGEDLLFLMQCMVRAHRQVHVTACCYGYRQRIGSASHSGMSARVLRDELGYVPRILQTFDASGKPVDKVLWRLYSNKLLERFVFLLGKMDAETRKVLWREWMSVVAGLLQLEKFPRFQRFRVRILRLFPFRGIAYVLCAVPYLLKARVGVRR